MNISLGYTFDKYYASIYSVIKILKKEYLYMNYELKIREVASKLLLKIYLESNQDLKATINLDDIKNEYNGQLIQKAGKYLIKKQLVSTNQLPDKVWEAIITYQGIDWVEDWYSNK